MDLSDATMLANDLRRLGIALPAQAQRVLDIRTAALTAAHANPAHGFAEELTAGTLTPEIVTEKVHAAALTATAQEKARTLLRDLSLPVRRAFGQAIRDDADRLVRDLRKLFNPASKTMQNAGQLFPFNATGEDVLAAGNAAGDAWRELAQARQTLELIHSARLTLARDFVHEPVPAQVLMYVKNIDSALGQARAEDAWNTPGSPVGGRWHALTAAGSRCTSPPATRSRRPSPPSPPPSSPGLTPNGGSRSTGSAKPTAAGCTPRCRRPDPMTSGREASTSALPAAPVTGPQRSEGTRAAAPTRRSDRACASRPVLAGRS